MYICVCVCVCVWRHRFALAVRHSPDLLKVSELPRGHPRARDGGTTVVTHSESGGTQAAAAGADKGAGKAKGGAKKAKQVPQEPEDRDTQYLGQGLSALDGVSYLSAYIHSTHKCMALTYST